MPFYLIRAAGYGESEAGLLLTAVPLAMGIGSFVGGWLCDRFGPRWLCPGGLALCAANFGGLSTLGQRAAFGEVAAPLFSLGLGLGLFGSEHEHDNGLCPCAATGHGVGHRWARCGI